MSLYQAGRRSRDYGWENHWDRCGSFENLLFKFIAFHFLESSINFGILSFLAGKLYENFIRIEFSAEIFAGVIDLIARKACSVAFNLGTPTRRNSITCCQWQGHGWLTTCRAWINPLNESVPAWLVTSSVTNPGFNQRLYEPSAALKVLCAARRVVNLITKQTGVILMRALTSDERRSEKGSLISLLTSQEVLRYHPLLDGNSPPLRSTRKIVYVTTKVLLLDW